MGFLPVGHTHEDIDQLFSCISRQLKHRNALTIPGNYSKWLQCTCVDHCFVLFFLRPHSGYPGFIHTRTHCCCTGQCGRCQRVDEGADPGPP